jgi:hypothetical protein
MAVSNGSDGERLILSRPRLKVNTVIADIYAITDWSVAVSPPRFVQL